MLRFTNKVGKVRQFKADGTLFFDQPINRTYLKLGLDVH